MSNIEQICSECNETNLVSKSYNCTSCRIWNKFEVEVIVKQNKKKAGKKWLS